MAHAILRCRAQLNDRPLGCESILFQDNVTIVHAESEHG
jgi:hypothetical protein